MPVSRMRMRPWLEDMIDSNSIAGLIWVDKGKKDVLHSLEACCTPWMGDGQRSLSVQTVGNSHCSSQESLSLTPKHGKPTFRCAMNSLPDIEEVKDAGINKGFGAVRVYRMLQVEKNKNKRSSKSQESRRRKKVRKIDADMESTEEHLYTHKQQDMITQENTIDSTESTNTASPTYVVPDCSDYEVEIGPDSTNNIYTGKVPGCTRKITRQLELDCSPWLQSNGSGKGFLCNEVALAESYQCPESQWSDTS
ncbi:interferon regulatory factor 1-like, partial [Clarias magur]